MRLLWSVLFAWVVVSVVLTVWWIWLRSEERKQRERMRQTVNGGGTDLPAWLRLREKRRR